MTVSDITNEALKSLKRNIVFSQTVNRNYSAAFGPNQKIGSTMTLRKPARYKP